MTVAGLLYLVTTLVTVSVYYRTKLTALRASSLSAVLLARADARDSANERARAKNEWRS